MQNTMYKHIIHKVSEYVYLGILFKYSWDSGVQEIKRD